MNNFENNDQQSEFQIDPNNLNIESTSSQAAGAGRALTSELNLELKRRSDLLQPGDVVRIRRSRFFTNEWAIVERIDNEDTCTLLARKGKLTQCSKTELGLIELTAEEKAEAFGLMMKIQNLLKKLALHPAQTILQEAYLKRLSVKEFPHQLSFEETFELNALESFVAR